MTSFMKSHDGLEIHYVYKPVKSSKPVILFLHGLGANYSGWKNTIASAKKRGYSTLAIDLRGHGLSSTPEQYEYYALEHFAKDIKNILTQLEIKKFILVGHSFGGSVAIVYCTKYIDASLQKMILIESTHKFGKKHFLCISLLNPVRGFLEMICCLGYSIEQAFLIKNKKKDLHSVHDIFYKDIYALTL